jgi:hypothetical protein
LDSHPDFYFFELFRPTTTIASGAAKKCKVDGGRHNSSGTEPIVACNKHREAFSFKNLDVTLQIGLFTKLKLTNCARAGDRAGLSIEHRRSIEILPVTLAEQERLLQPCGRRMALTPSRRRSPVSRLYFQERPVPEPCISA